MRFDILFVLLSVLFLIGFATFLLLADRNAERKLRLIFLFISLIFLLVALFSGVIGIKSVVL